MNPALAPPKWSAFSPVVSPAPASPMLLAPQSGKVTREAMRQKGHETADSARGLKGLVARRGEEVWEETARRVGAVASALVGNDTDQVASP
ncbi:MAG TPA: YtxH domain-containing protein [Vicinamibacteria bacterium]|nr:YtxH domain-containing protein [Vicinamibacteria bacterium]